MSRHVVDIAKMRDRITVQSQTQTPDGQGGVSIVWADVISVWAKVEPVSQRERIYSQALQYRRTHKVVMRFNSLTSTITTDMQIIFGSRTFQIKSIVDPDERGFYLALDCEENVGS